MANPALIKAAVVLLTDKRTWKAIGVVIAATTTGNSGRPCCAPMLQKWQRQ